LADTTYNCYIDMSNAGVLDFFTDEGPAFPVITFGPGSPREVMKLLAKATGTIPMPAKWTLGFQQCRWSYTPDSRVREVCQEFRNRDLPVDVIWLDIDYMNKFQCFTFDKETFPDPSALTEFIHGLGMKSVWMIDPGIMKLPGYFVYDQGTEKELWVLSADGVTPFEGRVWPGDCVFPDFTREATRHWWASLFKDYMATGIDGVWNDMNEPSVFEVASRTMDKKAIHLADEELGGRGTHAQYHNVYGMQMVRATREGMKLAAPDKRPFVLARASFMGGHRFAATWTGDNVSDWNHLGWSISMVINLGLSGQAITGPDIGGFSGEADGPLFARWMGIGCLLPFSRAHAQKGAQHKEPWMFGVECENTSRRALERRYQLMPTFYTLAHQCHTQGLPILRPSWFDDASNQALLDQNHTFLLGDSIFAVCDILPEHNHDEASLKALADTALPAGTWHRFGFGEADLADKDLPKLYIRAGGIVACGPIMQYVDERPLDPLTLLVCLDAAGKAQGQLYEDAGDGYAFEEGEYLLTTYSAEMHDGKVVVKVASTSGSRARPSRELHVRLVTGNGEVKGTGVDGEDVEVTVSPAGEQPHPSAAEGKQPLSEVSTA